MFSIFSGAFGEVEAGGDGGVGVDDDVSVADAGGGVFGFVGGAGDGGGVVEVEEVDEVESDLSVDFHFGKGRAAKYDGFK